MQKFLKKYDYDGMMDKEIIDLCDAMNSLPGIETSGSCSGHEKYPLSIFFKSTDYEGLFFLTRSIDNRYWKYGGKWSIKLIVGDMYENNYLPITYLLESEDIGNEAYKQATDLIENMVYHLNHKNFLKLYEINLEKFNL